MKRRKRRGKGLKALLALLILALVAVVGLILFKQHEYRVSSEYYDGLRSMRAAEGVFL